VLKILLENLIALYYPILPFTMEEIIGRADLPLSIVGSSKDPQDIHLPVPFRTEEIEIPNFTDIMALRGEVFKKLEDLRKDKQIGDSLETCVRFMPKTEKGTKLIEMLSMDSLAELLIVSYIRVEKDADWIKDADMDLDDLAFKIEKVSDQKCERCWLYLPSVGKSKSHPTICSNCENVVEKL